LAGSRELLSIAIGLTVIARIAMGPLCELMEPLYDWWKARQK